MNRSAARPVGPTRSCIAITPPTDLTKKARPNPMPAIHPMPHSGSSATLPNPRPFKLIGELINNSFARAARAWKHRDVGGFQKLAKIQTELGADYITLNIDGTQSMRVLPE